MQYTSIVNVCSERAFEQGGITMIFNCISALIMAALALYMVKRGTRRDTRLMAWIPAGVCGMELLSVGVLTPSAFPLLTVVLVLLRLTIAVSCVAALRHDAAVARAKQRRRERLNRELRTALHPLYVLEELSSQQATPGRRSGGFHCA